MLLVQSHRDDGLHISSVNGHAQIVHEETLHLSTTRVQRHLRVSWLEEAIISSSCLLGGTSHISRCWKSDHYCRDALARTQHCPQLKEAHLEGLVELLVLLCKVQGLYTVGSLARLTGPSKNVVTKQVEAIKRQCFHE